MPKKRSAPASKRKPLVITCHNVNGLYNHINNHEKELLEFLEQHKPDIHCIQEARLQSTDDRQGKIFDGYKLGKLNKEQERRYKAVTALFRKPVFNEYHVKWSLSRDPKQKSFAGTAVLYKKDVSTPMVRYWLADDDAEDQRHRHHLHGRHIIFEFPSFILLNTYAPNNQTKETGWHRRREWDVELLDYVRRMHDAADEKPLIWVGDLNTTTDDHDMDSAKYYRQDVYKSSPTWSQDFDATHEHEGIGGALAPDAPGDSEAPWLYCHGDKGQPGCTLNEQRRFREIRQGGHLVDAYRHLHPVETTVVQQGHEAWTWRGSAGRDGNPSSGRYWAKGMRIDYTLVHESLVPRIRRSEILGYSPYRTGFLGSDHCPILLELWPKGQTNSGMTAASKEEEKEDKEESSPERKKHKTQDGDGSSRGGEGQGGRGGGGGGSGGGGGGGGGSVNTTCRPTMIVNGHKQFTM